MGGRAGSGVAWAGVGSGAFGDGPGLGGGVLAEKCHGKRGRPKNDQKTTKKRPKNDQKTTKKRLKNDPPLFPRTKKTTKKRPPPFSTDPSRSCAAQPHTGPLSAVGGGRVSRLAGVGQSGPRATVHPHPAIPASSPALEKPKRDPERRREQHNTASSAAGGGGGGGAPGGPPPSARAVGPKEQRSSRQSID